LLDSFGIICKAKVNRIISRNNPRTIERHFAISRNTDVKCLSFCVISKKNRKRADNVACNKFDIEIPSSVCASETSYKGNSIYVHDPEVLGKAVQVGQKVIQHVTPILNCDGYNLLQNNGEVAGQTVFHFHLHLIPRYKDADNSNVLTTGHVSFSDEEMKEICESLRLN